MSISSADARLRTRLRGLVATVVGTTAGLCLILFVTAALGKATTGVRQSSAGYGVSAAAR